MVQSLNVVTVDLSPSSERHLCCIAGESVAQTGYTTWGLKEPSGFAGEACGGINNYAELLDISCNLPYPFVCEFEI
jgi:hypothetical protein